jgi:hypothetical protein
MRKIVIFSIIAAFLAGCASFTEVQRGSLSDAFGKASDENHGSRQVADSRREHEWRHDDHDEDSHSSWFLDLIFHSHEDDDCDKGRFSRSRPIEQAPLVSAKPAAVYLGFSLPAGMEHTDNYSALSGGFDSRLSIESESGGAHLFKAGYGRLVFPPNEPISRSVSQMSTFNFGYSFRQSLRAGTPHSAVLLMGGIGLKRLGWTYQNPVVTDEYDAYGNYMDTRSFYSDAVWGFSPSIGAGILFARTSPVRPALTLQLGGSLYSDKTNGSFQNDLFPADAYVKTSLEVEFRMP